MKQIITFLLLLSCTLSIYAQDRASKLKEELMNMDTKKVFVVSHRADWRNAPENSLQAIKNCIKMGVDMVEIDLKRTKDGHLILMHDKTINRTTTGKGLPEDYTLAQLEKFTLKNGAGHKTMHPIATLEEVMKLCKGKILVNIDKAYDYFHEVYRILEKTGTVEQCVIKSDFPYEKVSTDYGDILNRMTFMPTVNLDKLDAETIINDYIKNLQPKVFELIFKSESKKTLDLIAKVRKSGAKVFVNAMWPELCAGHDDDKAVERKKYDEAWGWIVEQDIHIIQTDRPKDLLKFLNKKDLRLISK